ncbi:MAG: adenosylcobalamin-dependent ribonucleoside-diphosphate reductase, partial [Candidatus Micrarchaeota archaeon]|nr:adenosylcobalamin-dependent ribonucleoside-diphosphate reductase [Candidatus Micrarchaeota archaeon]
LEVFNLAAERAWENGDPGLIFIDRINKTHPLRKIGEIESCNPCGEQPLLPYESCNLGSINLTKFVLSDGSDFDWDRLEIAIQNAIHFLDNVIDVNSIPVKEIEQTTKANRKIGLGVMGFADALIMLGIRYDSREALMIAEKLMKFIRQISYNTSQELAGKRGSYQNFKFSIYPSRVSKLRNATLNTIAPTGSLSIIAGVSSGIEPLFAVAYYRQVLENVRLIEVNKLFHSISIERGFYSRSLMEKISHGFSIQKMSEIPKDVRELFVTAYDIDPIWHLRMQAAFQKYVDNAVSKTVNLPYEAKVEDVQEIYRNAYELGVKGITVYRYGSRADQVIYLGKPKTDKEEPKGKITVSSEFSGCSSGICQL